MCCFGLLAIMKTHRRRAASFTGLHALFLFVTLVLLSPVLAEDGQHGLRAADNPAADVDEVLLGARRRLAEEAEESEEATSGDLVEVAAAEAVKDEEEEPPSRKDLGMSVLVLGILFILLGLLYISNSRIAVVQYYAWKLIKTGLDLFLAITLWDIARSMHKAFAALGEKKLAGGNHVHELCLRIFLPLLCTVVMQWVLLRRTTDTGEEIGGLRHEEVACEATSGICGHVVGFAWMWFWSSVQQVIYYSSESLPGGKDAAVFWLLVSVLMAYLTNLGLLRTMHAVRFWWLRKDYEHDAEYYKLWQEGASEAEVDAGAVHISFLLAQVLRYHITDDMPNKSGKIVVAEDMSAAQTFAFLSTAGSLGLFMLLLYFLHKFCFHKDPDEKEEDFHWGEKAYRLVRTVVAYSSGWMLLFFFQYGLQDDFFGAGGVTTVLEVFTAVLCTLVAIVGVRLLAGITTCQLRTGNFKRGKAAMRMTGVLGLMVGISWERVFDSAVENMAYWMGFSTGSDMGESVLDLFLIGVCLPAMFLHVCPRLIRAEHAKREEKYVRVTGRCCLCLPSFRFCTATIP
eukprot:TRINITY_DN19779_c0_g1_i3.p1 TRINITY_DN19779_c0_g1~~TRINITY_DN19779_c0_g1_i3.p1  ORF type:complete len:569 (-),score=88.46 TRINITY_DN19779_c0_g1_i3:124-1830(-)